ncbi:MepB family protein [Staphylococcus aureus]
MIKLSCVIGIKDINQSNRHYNAYWRGPNKEADEKSAYNNVQVGDGPQHSNQPYSKEAFADYLLIIVIDEELSGYFLFPRELLVEKGILTTFEHKGKMAFRVYPKWCNQLNKTAGQTQKWQCKYFFEY